jgi:hypothetical protein
MVYCFSKSDCELLTKRLGNQGIFAEHYHSELTYAEKLRAYSNWMSGVTLVCIAIVGCWNSVVSVLMFFFPGHVRYFIFWYGHRQERYDVVVLKCCGSWSLTFLLRFIGHRRPIRDASNDAKVNWRILSRVRSGWTWQQCGPLHLVLQILQ